MIKFIWSMLPFLFAIFTLAAVFVGYRLREFEYYSAEEGVGYALGIIGGSLMLALLLYPLRKRYKILRFMGNIKAWFGLHMIFGVVGPVLILFHANFSLGSTNSNVAFFSMLIVAISGVIGRYIYTKIHHGLYGQKIELAQLKNRLRDNQQDMSALLNLNPAARDEIFDFVDHVLTPPKGLLHSTLRIMSVGWRSRRLVSKIKKSTRQKLSEVQSENDMTNKEKRDMVRIIARETDHFLQRARRVVEFNFYERMFALWHVLHLPLFFMLVIAAFVHVFAVHWY